MMWCWKKGAAILILVMTILALVMPHSLIMSAVASGSDVPTAISASPEPYKVGALFAATGLNAAMGNPQKQTVEMIVDKINAAGGINGHPLEVITYDYASDTVICQNLADKLIYDDDVTAIIGPTGTGDSLAIVDMAKNAEIPLISCGAGIGIVTPTEGNDKHWVFSTPQVSVMVIQRLYDYLKAQGISKIAIITDTLGFGKDGSNNLKAQALDATYNFTITDDQTYGTNDADMLTQLTSIKDSDPEAIICWGFTPGSAVVAKNMTTLGMRDIPLFCSHAITLQSFITLAGDSANGVMFASGKLPVADYLVDSDPQKALLLKYRTDFNAEYGDGTANTFGGHAYDALSIVVEALKNAVDEDPGTINASHDVLQAVRAEIRDYIEGSINSSGYPGTGGYPGAAGVFNMSPDNHNGLSKDSLVMVKIVSGNWTLDQSSGWGWQNPLPYGHGLRNVWGSSSSDVFAVGDYGTILHYNGSTWARMGSGTTDHLVGVWGTSSSNVFVVGGRSDGRSYYGGDILHYDGNSWNDLGIGSSSALVDIWGSSGNDIFVVGTGGTILHFDGTTWNATNVGTTYNLWAVWGNSPTDVFAVGWIDDPGQHGVVLHYDGSTWIPMAIGDWDLLNDVWGTSASDVFVAGSNDGVILHYDGISWTTMDTGTHKGFSSVWGTSSSDVYAVGAWWDGSGVYGLYGLVMHYDGTTWSPMSPSKTACLNGVWGSSSSDIFAVGEASTIIHYDGTWTKLMPSGVTDNLYGVWAASPSDVFAVGGWWDGMIQHYDGTTWSSMAEGTTQTLTAIWGTSSSDIFAVGHWGAVLHYDGDEWSVWPSGTTSQFSAVWGSSSSDVFAVGGWWDGSEYLGVVFHYDGVSGSQMDIGTTGYLNSVWGSSSSDVFAVGGDNGTILHYDGNDWSPMVCDTAQYLVDVWGTSSSDVFAVGSTSNGSSYDGTIFHYDGAEWSSVTTVVNSPLCSVWGTSPSNVFAVGGGGTIIHYDGSTWRAMSSGTSYTLTDVRGTSSDVFAVGVCGTILHYPELTTITSLNPNQGYQGHTMAVTISGSNLTEARAVSFGSGIKVNSFTVDTAGQIIANISISGTANIGVRDVYVTVPAGVAAKTGGFTVLDGIPPSTPVVTDDEDYTTSTSQLHASWTSSDAESGIAEYQYAIGTSAGGTDVVGWTSTGTNTEFTKTGLSLTWGTTYYFAVKAKNGAGLWSAVGNSNGITVSDSSAPSTPVATDDGDYTTSNTQLHASWTSSDAESGIAEYQYAISTTAGGTDVVGWTSVGTNTQVTKTGLSLNVGTTYYFGVKAKNGAGLWSPVGLSDGIVCDSTPPSTPVVTDDGDYTTSTSQLHASWSASDNESGIAEYQYAIGTSAGGTDIAGWTSAGIATEITHTGLSITPGTKYYISVKAKNGAGLWSAIGTSDGIAVVAEGAAQKDIQTTGGIVQTTDGKITTEFPAGAVTDTVTVTITQVPVSSIAAAPKGFKVGNTFFTVEAVDADGNAIVTFSQPVTITVKYSEEDVAAAGGYPNNLVLAYYDQAAGQWQPLDTTVNTADKTLSAATTHFSTWAVLAKSPEALAAWIWIVIGIAGAAGTGIVAYFLRRRLLQKA